MILPVDGITGIGITSRTTDIETGESQRYETPVTVAFELQPTHLIWDGFPPS